MCKCQQWTLILFSHQSVSWVGGVRDPHLMKWNSTFEDNGFITITLDYMAIKGSWMKGFICLWIRGSEDYIDYGLWVQSVISLNVVGHFLQLDFMIYCKAWWINGEWSNFFLNLNGGLWALKEWHMPHVINPLNIITIFLVTQNFFF